MKILPFTFSVVTLSSGSFVTAQVVASYDFTSDLAIGQNATEAQAETVGGPFEGDFFEADVADVNVTAGGFTSGPGFDPIVVAAAGTLFAAEGQGVSDGTLDNINNAVEVGDYFGVTVTANPGFELELTSFDFSIGRSANGTQDYAVRSSVDNFAANIVFVNQATGTTISPQSIDLSGPDFQGLEAIELRIYIDDRVSNGSSASATFIDNVVLNGTVSSSLDTDGDGLPDGFESANSAFGYDPAVDDSASDFDGDSLTVAEELAVGTSVILADTDGDGFFDGAETNTGTFVSYDFVTNTGDTGSDPLLADTDGDGLLDGVEFGSGSFVDVENTGSNPNLLDSDSDGLDDGFEALNNEAGYDPNTDDSASDFDNDAASVAQEIAAGTSVLLADTDGDGFFDGAETNTGTFVSYDFVTNTGDTGSDPLVADTDGDGLLDGDESGTGVFVSGTDTGTDPNNADVDGDGFNDALELEFGGDPFVADSSLPNLSFGYEATGSDWLSALGTPSIDIDGDGALGSDGFVFFGDFTGIASNGQPYTSNIESSSLPSYLSSHGPGLDFVSIASAFPNYGMIDDPVLLTGADQFAGFALGNTGGEGSVLEVNTFDISGLLPGQVVRLGVLAGIESNPDGRWDPTAVVLAGPGGFRQSRLELEANPGGVEAGWLFFDLVDDGTYTISVTRRSDLGGSGIAGLTFDSIGGGPIPFRVANNPNGTDLDFNWVSRSGVVYNLLSNTSLDTDPATWPVVQSGLVPSIPDASLTIERPADPRRFYVIQEVPAP